MHCGKFKDASQTLCDVLYQSCCGQVENCLQQIRWKCHLEVKRVHYELECFKVRILKMFVKSNFIFYTIFPQYPFNMFTFSTYLSVVFIDRFY